MLLLVAVLIVIFVYIFSFYYCFDCFADQICLILHLPCIDVDRKYLEYEMCVVMLLDDILLLSSTYTHFCSFSYLGFYICFAAFCAHNTVQCNSRPRPMNTDSC